MNVNMVRARRKRKFLSCVFTLIGFGLVSRRKFQVPSDVLHSRSSARGVCPTLRDVSHTPGSKSLREKVWRDPKCMSGCYLLGFLGHGTPLCVVRKNIGLFNEALLVCSRQVDNSLLNKIHTHRLEELVEYCRRFLALELTKPCQNKTEFIPKILHTISHSTEIPMNVHGILLTNPGFTIHHVDDPGGLSFVLRNCGEQVAKAYSCIKPRAFRADLYRFCALFSQGGVYMDSDIVPLVGLDNMYSECSSFSLGFDQAQRRLNIDHIGMQMKILAGTPGNHISACMIARIVDNVKHRRQFQKNTLGFSGPQLLRECYLKFSDNVAVTYIDTRGADWPFSGLRSGPNILAYEKPNATRHFDDVADRDKNGEYNDMVKKRDLYETSCAL